MIMLSALGDHATKRVVFLTVLGLIVVEMILYYSFAQTETRTPRMTMAECIKTTDRPPVELINPGLRLEETTSTKSPNSLPAPKITKVTMLYGEWANDERYKGVIQNQQDHADLHGHGLKVLRSQTMSGFWSKLSYMMMLILEELEKPEQARTKWLFWVDSDVIVMNRHIPLDLFLPPEDGFSGVNAVITHDHAGLNSGTFFLRVNEWSVRYLADIIAFHGYRPMIPLKPQIDQHSQEFVSKDARYKNETIVVPPRWFNAVRRPEDFKKAKRVRRSIDLNTFKPTSWHDYKANVFEPGDFHMHFAGDQVKGHILEYVGIAANKNSEYQKPLDQIGLPKEVAEFWNEERKLVRAAAAANAAAKDST